MVANSVVLNRMLAEAHCRSSAVQRLLHDPLLPLDRSLLHEIGELARETTRWISLAMATTPSPSGAEMAADQVRLVADQVHLVAEEVDVRLLGRSS